MSHKQGMAYTLHMASLYYSYFRSQVNVAVVDSSKLLAPIQLHIMYGPTYYT